MSVWPQRFEQSVGCFGISSLAVENATLFSAVYWETEKNVRFLFEIVRFSIHREWYSFRIDFLKKQFSHGLISVHEEMLSLLDIDVEYGIEMKKKKKKIL